MQKTLWSKSCLSWMPRFFKKYFLICKSLFFSQPTQFWDHMQESSQWNCGKDYFITLHVGRWQIHCSLGPRACGRESLLGVHWRNTPASQGYIFLSFLQTLEATVPIPALSPTAIGLALSLSASPLSNPFTKESRWRWSCRCTARKHAAATIIALIARFFCWAEISSGATILLLIPPKTSK